ncbi:uncharacterized protein L201_003248 [Kwoniella dendrophila CBS 6074]|uniref:ASTRA-associated protein 1 n=1 Tax=Kwoniella dendrophila CBS 6074 TaxID=1295534 RepID=A0AAX4JTW3_9TREE
MSSPPPPFHLLRSHHSPLSSLCFNQSNTLLYSGDQDGYITILDLRARRVIAYWKGHEGGVLGLEEWQGGLVSHGRDNVIHFYDALKKPYISFGIGGKEKKGPEIIKSLPTNALNFCEFSLLPLSDSPNSEEFMGNGKGKGKQKEALLAVPSLMDSELVDIYHLPSRRRIHASVNYSPKPNSITKDSVIPEETRSGLVMSIHLRQIPSSPQITLSMGYEDGRVELFISTIDSISEVYDARMLKSPNPWKLLWKGKGHNEAIMGMDVDSMSKYGWTVSADHRLVRYDFGKVIHDKVNVEERAIIKDCAMKQIGNSSVAVNASGKVVAVGGWDGKIRLFSSETFKPLGTLSSHRETVHAISFASPPLPSSESHSSETEDVSTIDIEENDDSDSEIDVEGLPPRKRWLASGGKDTKVALWGLMDFERGLSMNVKIEK